MRQLGRHPAEVQKGAPQNAAALPHGPLGKGERQVPHPDAAMRTVDEVADERAELSDTKGEAERERGEHTQHAPQRDILEPFRDGRPPAARAHRLSTPPRRFRAGQALGQNRHRRAYVSKRLALCKARGVRWCTAAPRLPFGEALCYPPSARWLLR